MTRARRFSRYVAAPIAVLTFGVGRADERGEALLFRALEAHGGLEGFQAIRDWRIVADRRILSAEPEYEVYEELYLHEGTEILTRLTKRRVGETLVFGHDGRRGFALVDGVERDDPGAEGEGYYRAHGEFYLRAIPFKWADPGVRIDYVGAEPALELLRVASEQGVGRAWEDVWVGAFHRESLLLHEARLTHHRDREGSAESASRETVEITYRYSDYREVGRLRFPFKLEYFSGGRKTGENVIRSFELNVGLTKADLAP